MPKMPLTTQAALIYEAPPELSLSALLSEANADLAKSGLPAFEMGPASSAVFGLFTAPAMHATVAVHPGPLGTRGLERALAAETSEARMQQFEAALIEGRAHVVIAVGEGPSPVRFDTPTPVPVETRLKVLATLMKSVMGQARPLAGHNCAADRMFTVQALEDAVARAPEHALLLHPEILPAQTGPDGESGTGLVLFNSHYLLGRTLVIEGVPEQVPAAVTEKLAKTLIRQACAGKINLDDGASLRDAAGTTLHIRHEAPDQADPAGRIVASFWTGAATDGGADTAAPFISHPGYAAVPVEEHPEPTVGREEWSGVEPSAHLAEKTARTGPNWMLWVGFGLFLWIGLPLLNVPKMAIEAAFSSSQQNPFLDR